MTKIPPIIGPGAKRYDGLGEIRCMAAVDGYCMARRPGCIPFVLSVDEWLALAPKPDLVQ
jgi:hypothetical protein